MNSVNLFGKVKIIIRKKENPDAVGLLTKLISANPHINKIKFQYTPSPSIVMAPLTMKTKENVPIWITKLTPHIEKYLNVAIIRDKRLIGNRIEPIHSLTVIGEEQMAILATHYIDTIFTSINRLVASKREQQSGKAKINRRRKRDGESMVPMTDAREVASQLKTTIILSILGTLDNLLDDCRYKYPVSFKNGCIRDDYIETTLRTKYTNSWKHGLSTRFG